MNGLSCVQQQMSAWTHLQKAVRSAKWSQADSGLALAQTFPDKRFLFFPRQSWMGLLTPTNSQSLHLQLELLAESLRPQHIFYSGNSKKKKKSDSLLPLNRSLLCSRKFIREARKEKKNPYISYTSSCPHQKGTVDTVSNIRSFWLCSLGWILCIAFTPRSFSWGGKR